MLRRSVFQQTGGVIAGKFRRQMSNRLASALSHASCTLGCEHFEFRQTLAQPENVQLIDVNSTNRGR